MPDSLGCQIVRLLDGHGLLAAEPEHPTLDIEVGLALDQLQAVALKYRKAIGSHAGRKAAQLYIVPPLKVAPNNPLLETTQTAMNRALEFDDPTWGYQEGRIVSPGDLSPGQDELTWVASDPISGPFLQQTITFDVQPTDSIICTG